MVSSDFRKEAREKLSGKWGKAACITLAYVFIFAVLDFIGGLFSDAIEIESLISLAVAIIQVPLALGLIISLVKLFNGEDVKAFGFLSSGFNNFGKSWGLVWNIFLKTLAPTLLLFLSTLGFFISIGLIVGETASHYVPFEGYTTLLPISVLVNLFSSIWYITKMYYYQLSYILIAENPELSAKEAVEESEKLMAGKRGKLFCLQLSFIGWAILAVFTLGIGYLWLVPYIQFATVAFYKFANGDNDSIEATVVDENKTEE